MRRIIRLWLASLATVGALTSVATVAHANLIVNGSFELHGALPTGPDNAGGSSPNGIQWQNDGSYWTIYGKQLDGVTPGTGVNVINGWTVSGISVDLKKTYWQPSNGQYSIDLNGTARPSDHGNAQGAISQTFATQAGHVYTVQFDLAGNPDGPPAMKTVRASAAGQHVDFTFNMTGHTKAAMGWVTETFTFVANAATSTLSFASFGPDDQTQYGGALDNVIVNEGEIQVHGAPEPTSLTLLGLGGLGLAGFRRWRKSRAG